ncbi:adenylyltransferase/sulfurtransferase [Evansella vedderi]|uniref:Adenylyltransferase/sulfurtransferase n=1 Tax=Evansella vedderi TaxID=38282 RepID=A0ABT9ZYC5_9BACI|nr:ThiF family adenylyltransferase [Evansella vedderi]MDQ0255849.1 adenylyltransferase/sulfurtransferase [Evansella vedderi]
MNVNVNKYSRQILFWPNGQESQQLLQSKTVSIIGIGALGTALANHLVRAGIGEIRLIDRDFVEESNLQRQMLFDEKDVNSNKPKAIAANEKLSIINSEVKIIPIVNDVNNGNIESLVSGSDLILDGTDNMETRFLINDVSIKLGIPWIYAGVVHSRAMTATIIPGITPCFACLFPNVGSGHGETCDTVGVLSTAVHIIASYQATEAFKLLIEHETYRREDMVQLDIWKNDYETFPFQYSLNPDCPCCRKKQFAYLDNKTSDKLVSSLCGRDAIQITPLGNEEESLDLTYLKDKWSKIGKVEQTPFLLRLNYEDYQISLFKTGRIIIKGTTDTEIAKRLYSTLVGN